jgi:hypothetical protein
LFLYEMSQGVIWQGIQFPAILRWNLFICLP